ncbi:calcium-binding protein [Primorskyibacter sp. S187A]|uniref:calcium-binding protein n=1 Tax=Primorskyibacter sp. S187A TaxID=3415130 RepID=UPI003C7C2D4D
MPFRGIRPIWDQLILYGTNSDDFLVANGTIRILHGLGGDDVLVAKEAGTFLNGGSGDDTLVSGLGADTIDGGSGSDTVSYAGGFFGPDLSLIQSGAVTVNLMSGTGSGGFAEGDVLTGIENVRGSNFDDILIGNNNDNRLLGGSGADTLLGMDGDDYIVGGGNVLFGEGDFLSGGAGADTFAFSMRGDSGGGQAVDFIADFGDGDDRIALFAEQKAIFDDFLFLGEASGFSSFFLNEVRYTHDADSTHGAVTNVHARVFHTDLSYDTVSIMLDGHLALTASDFEFDFV